MPVPADFVPGAPCWTELRTSDPRKATAFYGALFDWQTETGGEEYGSLQGQYTLFTKDGLPIAGLAPNEQGREPDTWCTYLASEDAAA
ncbi:VOC family protein, partial [Arthrobacter deserti]|nr:VOC family protein [Arthrobacter deserti]